MLAVPRAERVADRGLDVGAQRVAAHDLHAGRDDDVGAAGLDQGGGQADGLVA